MGTLTDLVGIERRGGGKPQQAAGAVVSGAVAVGDPITVQLIGWPADAAYEIPAGHWQPRADPAGVQYPASGARCLVVFDHLGDAWVPIWSS